MARISRFVILPSPFVSATSNCVGRVALLLSFADDSKSNPCVEAADEYDIRSGVTGVSVSVTEQADSAMTQSKIAKKEMILFIRKAPWQRICEIREKIREKNFPYTIITSSHFFVNNLLRKTILFIKIYLRLTFRV